MPQKNAKATGRKRKGRRGRKRRVVTLSNRQASTKAYDSRIEKVIARVARQEDNKQKEKLVYRQYLFGPYDMSTNIFASSTRVSFTGHITPLATIQKVDNATAFKVLPVPNPYQTPATYIDPGTNVIANVLSYDGFRRGNWVTIHGISVGFQGKLPAVGAAAAPLFEHANLYLQICLMQWDGSDAIAATPHPDACGNMVPLFGYTPKTDLVIVDKAKPFKRRTLWKTHLKFRVDAYDTDLKRFNHYIDLSKNPVKIQYKDFDQNGQEIERWKPFLVARSDIPDFVAYQPYMPDMNMVVKLHYTDT